MIEAFWDVVRQFSNNENKPSDSIEEPSHKKNSEDSFLAALPVVRKIVRRRFVSLRQAETSDLEQGIILRLLNWREKYPEKSEKMSTGDWESFAARTTNKSEADRFEKIIRDSEKNNNVGRIQDLLEGAAKELQIIVPNLTKEQESKISQQNDSTDGRQPAGKSQEISNQNAISEASVRASHQHIKAEIVETEKTTVKEKGRTR